MFRCCPHTNSTEYIICLSITKAASAWNCSLKEVCICFLSLKVHHIARLNNIYPQGSSQWKWLGDMFSVLLSWSQEENADILKSSSVLKVTLSWWLLICKWGTDPIHFFWVLSKSVWNRRNTYSSYLWIFVVVVLLFLARISLYLDL